MRTDSSKVSVENILRYSDGTCNFGICRKSLENRVAERCDLLYKQREQCPQSGLEETATMNGNTGKLLCMKCGRRNIMPKGDIDPFYNTHIRTHRHRSFSGKGFALVYSCAQIPAR